MGMDWPHTEEITRQHHQTGPPTFVVLHISVPYKSTHFIFELKNFIFVPLEMFWALHTFPKMLKMNSDFANSVLYISMCAAD
jgi:hypothetical protein